MAILLFTRFLLCLLVGILQLGQAFPFHLFIYLYGFMNSYFIQWVIIHYYHIFKAKLSLIWSVGPPCPFETSMHSLSISLFSSTRRCSRPILHFRCPPTLESAFGHFSKDPGFFQYRVVFRNQYLGACCTQCS